MSLLYFVLLTCVFLPLCAETRRKTMGVEPAGPCNADQLMCDSGKCINRRTWCDSAIDCDDGSDEKFCANPRNLRPLCKAHHFKCTDGTCIPLSARCDDFEDCKDGSDENCAEGSVVPKLGKLQEMEPGDRYSRALGMAGDWLLAQRKEDYGWESESARALVALTMGDLRRIWTDEDNLMVKQLNIHIMLHLIRNNSLPTLRPGRLALYVNSLLATCQNPRNFQGLDLVRELRRRTDLMLRSGEVVPPTILLTLCLVGESQDQDFRHHSNVMHSRNSSSFKIDMQAIAAMSMACMVKQPKYRTYANHFAPILDRLMIGYEQTGPFQDVYTTALVVQAMNAGIDRSNRDDVRKKTDAMETLLRFQLNDGSFGGNILATYYAMPALAGGSLLQLADVNCSEPAPLNVPVPLEMPKSQDNVVSIRYTLWVGQDPVVDTHTMTLTVGTNHSFFDVMRLAETKSEFFRFSYDDTYRGKVAYSIAGIPNDAEREFSWTLFRNQLENPEMISGTQPVPYANGVDTLMPRDEDHLVFWFKHV